MFGLTTPLSAIPGVGARFAQRFAGLGLKTVRDLLYHFPSRYEDFSRTYKIADLEPGQHATIQGIVRDIELRQSWRKRMVIVEATIEDDSGVIHATWFNQPYVKNTLREGTLANFSGKVSVLDGELSLAHPTYELLRRGLTRTEADLRGNEFGQRQSASGQRESASAEGTIHTGRLVPIYPETYGLTSKGIRYVVQPILANLPELEEWIPLQVRLGGLARTDADPTLTYAEKNERGIELPEINKAIHDIHFPETLGDALSAQRRFDFEDLFLLQLVNLEEKLKLRKNKAPAIPANIENIKKIIQSLPFQLTLSQKKSLWEILQDMEKPVPMNRLLQGDVGSGKTVVAALAAITSANAGYETAIMAPTEVLARQHYSTFKHVLEGARINADEKRGLTRIGADTGIALITGGTALISYGHNMETTGKKSDVQKAITRGEIKIVIGTHALISGGKKSPPLTFPKLALVIIDEQHRFGVQQRALLAGKTENLRSSAEVPHFLSMSATPIPRTLMLTVFGDLDLSTITEMPTGRKKIVTQVIPPEERMGAYGFIREEIKKGRQAFVICPRIEPTALSQTNAPARPSGGDLTQTNAEKIINSKRQDSSPRQSAYSQRESAVFVETKTVSEEYEKLSKKIFPDLRVAMLHGQLKPIEKVKIMADFHARKTDILISTSVIEVGVDVPNATIMMIEGSERFGLSQLYQFRGRVGRGEHQSYCFLFTDSSGKTTQARLKAIVQAKNGFELAERDLALRGPGEFVGKNQTGMPDIAMRGLQDPALIASTRGVAMRIIEKSPNLKEFPPLKTRLAEFRKKLHME